MSTYRLKFSKRAVKQLSKLDKGTAKIIVAWLEKNIENCSNPRLHGKSLAGNYAGAWRYRIGNYRALCEILDDELIVYTFEVAHRKEVYKR
ncbi:MAG: type II toxin-antitoxin system RelE/ParE family toxin [Atopobiaceae bacterium]|nr:type II toxin-antitoxin system RelE/ParE family toxin [Atopobiaceae bacterium]